MKTQHDTSKMHFFFVSGTDQLHFSKFISCFVASFIISILFFSCFLSFFPSYFTSKRSENFRDWHFLGRCSYNCINLSELDQYSPCFWVKDWEGNWQKGGDDWKSALKGWCEEDMRRGGGGWMRAKRCTCSKKFNEKET